MESHFILGNGLYMPFNGNAYQSPDFAAIEEGKRLEAMGYKKITVFRVDKEKSIYTAKTDAQKCLERLGNCFKTQPRCQQHTQHAYA